MAQPVQAVRRLVTARADRPRVVAGSGSAKRVSDGPGAPGRVALFTGARGIGKTVMLNEFEDAFLADGWLAVGVTATPACSTELFRRRRRCWTGAGSGAAAAR